MKQIPGIFKFIVCLAIVMCSCRTDYFTNPQPIDSDNIYEFPEVFRGTWLLEDGDTMTIRASYFRYVQYTPRKIVISTRQMIKQYASRGFNITIPLGDSAGPAHDNAGSGSGIRYEEKVDSAARYLIKKNKVYEIDRKEGLSGGFPFSTKGDTIFYNAASASENWLGRNFFLRSIAANLYLVNIRNELLSGDKPWWIIILLENRTNGTISVRSLDEKFEDSANELYSTASGYDPGSHYFDAQWTKKDILQLIAGGAFSQSLHDVKIKDKLPKK